VIPYGKQFIDNEDIDSVVEVLKSDFLTTGPKVSEFEEKLADYCGAKYAVVFNSGTSALHAAYFSAGLEKDDEFITSANTFIATSNAGLFIGAKPVFCDIEIKTGNMDCNEIENLITKKTKAIIPVHYAGHPCNMQIIKKIADKYNLIVIEDACHALGSYFKEHKTGSCVYSDMTVFSFHPVKHITTGEGGAVLTNNSEYVESLKLFRNHGLSNKLKSDTNKVFDSDIFNKMMFIGYNYRLTDIQAALGISQLKKLDNFVKKRQKIASFYNYVFDGNDYFDIPIQNDYSKSSWHLYPIRLKDEFKHKRNNLVEILRKNGLGVQIHYPPVYFHPYYQKLQYKEGLCKKAESFFYSEISLPIFPSLTDKNMNNVMEIVLDNCKNIFS
jgi:UDP-4-amino-4,6-dideoxy-N-acetyl-beta-L-altrosamine transaminase